MRVPILDDAAAVRADGTSVGELETHQAGDLLTAPAYLPGANDIIVFHGNDGGRHRGEVSHLYREYDAEGRMVVLEIILKEGSFEPEGEEPILAE